MATIREIHEGGLIASSVSESRKILISYGLRPVLHCKSDIIGDFEFLRSIETYEPLELQLPAISSPTIENMSIHHLYKKASALEYDAGAVLYHCRNLANEYSVVLAQHERIRELLHRSIPGYKEPDFMSVGNQNTIYYEFDALLSASRRVYDKIAHLLWQAFIGGGSMKHMKEALKDNTFINSCPQPLATRLEKSWTSVGAKLKDYRDHTQHFGSTDIGLCTVSMERLANNTWRVRARIPDNPVAKSKKKFTYALGHDALTYGWEITNEIMSLAIEAVAVSSASTHGMIP